ncbi:gliding motility protein GldM [Lutibacter sp. HS1-25]|uniref:type IX secretion system motor protein PorM/GldM n=1 Tax=Lutibacter sp. HS1-25 TaxID=2485000 RepID=UPI001010D3A7|nr:gliding motility protein GldM [Lutibacter sp. HS1-25]RXP54123.1 gliding motility protein GldM [Lutibacter sp. HS1-25]
MAGGKLSPRQKMINLMYLVFIAMIAMQMSKQVLSAFGYMNEKLTDNNELLSKSNLAKYNNLKTKAAEQPDKYADKFLQVEKLKDLSVDFTTYLDSLKVTFLEGVDDAKDYESMDKTSTVDEYFFIGDKITKNGQLFLDHIATYRDGCIGIIGANNPLAQGVANRFDTSVQKTRDGKDQPWLKNRFEGFPLISTLTALTSLQTDIKITNAEVYNAILGGQLEEDAGISGNTYRTILIPEKSAFFQGENFKGKIVLGRYDATLKPSEVIVNGNKVTTFKDGGVELNFPAGAVGERDVKGKFVFIQDGKPVEIPISSSYAVIPKPNSAVISADKMNVVYMGVDNPMTISIPGISDDKVKATANGLTKIAGVGKYVMKPTSGKEVTINVSGVLPDGQTVTNSQVFRIKGIPSPSGTIRKEAGYVKMQKTSLEKATVGAELMDFDFDLSLNTIGFTIKVPGQSAVVVNGDKMDDQAKKAIAKSKRGDVITIFDIKSALKGNSTYKIKPAAAVSIEIE